MEKSLNRLVERQHELSSEMEAALASVVREHGGKIDVSASSAEGLFAFVYNEDLEAYVECPVYEIEADGKNVFIKVEGIPCEEGESGCWVSVTGGLTNVNATLYNLCVWLSDNVK